MRKVLAAFLLCIPLCAAAPQPKVKITTSLGAFTVQLEPDTVPITVDNFLKYVRKGFYGGTIFHRISKTPAVVQGGGLLPDMSKKKTDPSIKNEADAAKAKGLLNKRGTIAMARESLPDSAKAQFFINLKNNPDLDFKTKTLGDYGYCVFGKVIQGMEVVDKISKVKCRPKPYEETPAVTVTILSAEEVK
jgi:cyclophilin family peptidyl-prolyl cis-trans isomerase